MSCTIAPTLSRGAKRILAILTVRVLQQGDHGASPEVRVDISDFKARFPSLTVPRLKELLGEIQQAAISSPDLGIERHPISSEFRIPDDEPVVDFRPSSAYLRHITEIGCLPA